MSVIAWDGKSIAADSGATCNGSWSLAQKLFHIHVPADVCIGFVGSQATGLLLVDWWTKGADADKWPKFQDTDDWSRLIVWGRSGIFTYERWPVALPIREPFTAFGSGADYALGALAHGATAKEAVEVTIKLHNGCRGPVDVFTPNWS